MVARALLFALCLSGCAAQPESGPRSALAPGPLIRGARLENAGPYTLLVNPVAVAGQGHEVYVADAGLALLARIDPYAGVMAPIVRRAFVAGTRLAADADGTLYVLDPAERRVRRYARNGQLLADYRVDATAGSVTDMVLDRARGRLIVADALNRQLVAFHPLGRAFEVLPLRESARDSTFSISGLASGRDELYVSDTRCACVVRIARHGQVLGTFGHGDLRRPGRIVVDRYERVIVADDADRSLKVFRGGRLAEQAALGLFAVADMALADDWIYIADTAGRQVRALRVLPP